MISEPFSFTAASITFASCRRERYTEGRPGANKNPVPYRDGTLLFPRYHPIYPANRTSLSRHQHAPSRITSDEPRPGLLGDGLTWPSRFRWQLRRDFRQGWRTCSHRTRLAERRAVPTRLHHSLYFVQNITSANRMSLFYWKSRSSSGTTRYAGNTGPFLAAIAENSEPRDSNVPWRSP